MSLKVTGKPFQGDLDERLFCEVIVRVLSWRKWFPDGYSFAFLLRNSDRGENDVNPFKCVFRNQIVLEKRLHARSISRQIVFAAMTMDAGINHDFLVYYCSQRFHDSGKDITPGARYRQSVPMNRYGTIAR